MEPVWNAPIKITQIQKGAIHIWRASLDLPSRDVRRLEEKLSVDERIKAERFRFDWDKNRYIVSFGILKQILSLYIGVDPASVRISYGTRGKPRLKDAYGEDNIHFNLSHSEGLAIYIFARDHEVGVDIERIRDIPEMDNIVDDFFSPREKISFKALSRSKKRKAFFRLWTRKEAYIKAIGEGMYLPLDSFDISLIPRELASPLRLEGGPKIASRWLIQDLEPTPGFAGAFAIERRNWRIHWWNWLP
jgi:4'-phosphopantetheinyl transferase